MASAPAGLFKTACEICSKSKIKCSGGNPCKYCDKKGLQCVYAFKKKRGPRTDGDVVGSVVKKVKPDVMSSFERRIWTTFFTIFKSQKKNANDNPYAWGWFVHQLRRLDSYVKQSNSAKGERLRELLASFYQTLAVSDEDINSALPITCSIPPHLCPECSNLIFSSMWEQHSENCEKAAVDPKDQVTTPRSQAMMRSFLKKFNSGTHACLVYECSNNEFGVFVNKCFTERFKHDNKSLNETLKWSGGGFLSWGGDILASLLVYDSDLLIYLQIMAAKYQANGISGCSQEERIIPSLQAFKLWVVPDGKAELEPVLVQFTCTLRIKPKGKFVFTRLELVLLDDEVVADEKDVNCPERVVHEGQLVPMTHEGGKDVLKNSNEDVWSSSSTSAESGTASLSEEESNTTSFVKTLDELNDFTPEVELPDFDLESFNPTMFDSSSEKSDRDGPSNLDLVDAYQLDEKKSEVQDEEALRLLERIDDGEDDVFQDFDEAWLNGLQTWAKTNAATH